MRVKLLVRLSETASPELGALSWDGPELGALSWDGTQAGQEFAMELNKKAGGSLDSSLDRARRDQAATIGACLRRVYDRVEGGLTAGAGDGRTDRPGGRAEGRPVASHADGRQDGRFEGRPDGGQHGRQEDGLNRLGGRRRSFS